MWYGIVRDGARSLWSEKYDADCSSLAGHAASALLEANVLPY